MSNFFNSKVILGMYNQSGNFSRAQRERECEGETEEEAVALEINKFIDLMKDKLKNI